MSGGDAEMTTDEWGAMSSGILSGVICQIDIEKHLSGILRCERYCRLSSGLSGIPY